MPPVLTLPQAPSAFFLDLGLELQGEGSLEGAWLDQVVGLNDVKTSFAFFRAPELCRYLAWLTCILSASEIHCIDSSFALLIDSLVIDPSVCLYLHRYARPAVSIPTYRLHWEYLT